MKYLTLILLLCCGLGLQAQGDQIIAVFDSICVQAGEVIDYNVTDNDQVPNGANLPVFLQGESECFQLAPDGRLILTQGAGNCCGEYLFTYTYADCEDPTFVCSAEILLIIKCPKPDCSNVDLSGFLGGGSDASNPMNTGCVNTCENASATYFLPYNDENTYNWSVIGGTFVAGSHPAEIICTWGSAGSGSIILTITDVNGQPITSNICVNILMGPTADFEKSVDSICLNSTVYFTNNSLDGNSYFWDFGDGFSSNAFAPSHAYTTPGTYEVTLTVTKDNFGPDGEPLCCCTDTMTMEVVVEPLSGPGIYWVSTLCAGDSSKYWTDATNCSNYTWTVLDENDNALTFTGQGTDTICVGWGDGPFGQIILDVMNCDSAYCNQPTNAIVPIISPSVGIGGLTEVCENEVATYTVPKWVSVDYNWVVTGGTVLSGQGTNTIAVQWGTAPGPGTISLDYGSEFLSGLPEHGPGDCAGSGSLSVAIRPAFSMTGPSLACVNTNSGFAATATPSSAYTWTVSPAASFTGQGTNFINISWDSGPGIFTVTATPNDPNAYCNESVTQSIRVVELEEPDGIDGPVEICPGGTDTYFGLSSTPGVGFLWTVTGGTPTSTTGNPLTVTWNNSGPYQLELQQFSLSNPFCTSDAIELDLLPKVLNGPLVVTGPDGCTNSVQTYSVGPLQHPETDFQWTITPTSAGSIVSGQGTPTVTVQWNDTPVTPDLQVVASLCGNSIMGNLTVTLNDVVPPNITQIGDLCPGQSATLDAGTGYVAYTWSNLATTQTTSITTEGTYLVTVTDVSGCTEIATYQAVELEGPVASISTGDERVLCINPPNNTGSTTLTALTAPGYTYTWYCNGVLQPLPVTQAFFTHNNTQVLGTFNYWVVVTDSDGCSNQSNTITVSQIDCTGSGEGCTPEQYSLSFVATNQAPDCNVVDFAVSSSPNVTLTGWDFSDPDGNINSGNLSNAEHTYPVAGCYLVTLTATVPSVSTPGTNCVVRTTGSVCVPLAADFSSVVNCLSVDFCDLSTSLPGEQPVSWFWDFGDGNTSTGNKPTHFYSNGGTYPVTLTVTNANNCSATYSETVTVEDPPSPVISASPTPICVGTPVNFSAPASGIISWLWDFGDGVTNGAATPSHTYLTDGSYTVSLMVINEQGCSNTVSLPLTVFPNPADDTIAWTPSLEVCAGNTVTLTAPAGVGYTYLWSNGPTSSSISVNTGGTYAVTVTDANNCQLIPDPVTVVVFPAPTADITGPTVICDDDCITLMASLGFGYSYQWYGNGGTLLPGETAASLEVCDNTLMSPYHVEVTDLNGCTATADPFAVSLEVAPSFTISVAPDPCEGSLSTLTVSPVQPDVIYSWSTGESGDNISVLAAGLYTAFGTDTITGCRSSASATIHPLPDLCLVPVGCYESCNPDTICAPAGLTAYQWNLNGVPITGATGECLIVEESGTYSLTGTTEFGCSLTSDSLILELINCDCDGLMVTSEPDLEDDCCRNLSFDNATSLDLYGMVIYTDDANLDVNLGSIHGDLMTSGTTPQSISLIGAGGSSLPTGTLADFMEFCFSDVQNSPQRLIIDWYDFDFEVACSDTLFFDCAVEPDCLYPQSDSIYCEGDQVVYDLTVCNPVDADFSVGFLDLLVAGPAGIIVSPPNYDLTTNPILPGDCRTLTFLLSGADPDVDDFCYRLVAHDEPPLIDTSLCCSLDTTYCVPIPDCNPCDDILVEYVEDLSSEEGLCCYEIGLFNGYEPNYFDGIAMCMLTPGASLTMNNPFGSGWATTVYSPTVMEVVPTFPQGTSIPLGLFSLPEICVATTTGPDQMLEIKWLQGDSVVCRDTILLGCEPPCGYVVEETVECNSAGGWQYAGAIKNTSMFTMGEAHVVFTSPAGMNVYNTTLSLGSLPPGGLFPFSLPLGAPAMPGDTVCYTIALHELDDGATHTNCCNFEGCFVLPQCDLPLSCVCDDEFYNQISLGIECIPTPLSGVYQFTPIGDFTSCDTILWRVRSFTSQQTGQSIGNGTIEFGMLSPGVYNVCMLVSRTDINGELCRERVCKKILVPQLGTPIEPVVYPNPATGEFIIKPFPGSPITQNIVLLDMLGREVLRSPLPNATQTDELNVNLEGLKSGVYWVKLHANGKQWLRKLIVL